MAQNTPDTIQLSLFDYFHDVEYFSTAEAYEAVNVARHLGVNNESVRARIYEGIDSGIFERVGRGVYKVVHQIEKEDVTCLLINGDGRDLSGIEDNSIDGIITDHPYDLGKSLDGGNRKFAEYERFRYEKRDMDEKFRVLKPGAFCVEFLPEESEQNWRYLAEIKEMAADAGLKYYAKVPWTKGAFVSNTGRKAHNTEDVLILSKGRPRALKPDNKKNLAVARENGIETKGFDSVGVAQALAEAGLPVATMGGTAGMLPTTFDHQPPSRKERTHSAEKPVELLEEIIGYISRPDEWLLDQFAGSGNLAIAAAETGRNAIVIEYDDETYEKMRDHVVEKINPTSSHVEEQMPWERADADDEHLKRFKTLAEMDERIYSLGDERAEEVWLMTVPDAHGIEENAHLEELWDIAENPDEVSYIKDRFDDLMRRAEHSTGERF